MSNTLAHYSLAVLKIFVRYGEFYGGPSFNLNGIPGVRFPARTFANPISNHNPTSILIANFLRLSDDRQGNFRGENVQGKLPDVRRLTPTPCATHRPRCAVEISSDVLNFKLPAIADAGPKSRTAVPSRKPIDGYQVPVFGFKYS